MTRRTLRVHAREARVTRLRRDGAAAKSAVFAASSLARPAAVRSGGCWLKDLLRFAPLGMRLRLRSRVAPPATWNRQPGLDPPADAVGVQADGTVVVGGRAVAAEDTARDAYRQDP